MIAIQQKLRPYIIYRNNLELLHLIGQEQVLHDYKLDDCYINEDCEPAAVDIDNLQSMTRPQKGFEESKTYSIDYVKDSKVIGEMERIIKEEQLQQQMLQLAMSSSSSKMERSVSRLGSSLSKMLQNKKNSIIEGSQSASKKKESNAQQKQKEIVTVKEQQLIKEQELNEEELKQVDYLRDLINRKKFQFVRNAQTHKNQKILMSDSTIMQTTGLQRQSSIEKPINLKNQNYTFDQNGNILFVKKINPSHTQAAKKDMKQNTNFQLPQLTAQQNLLTNTHVKNKESNYSQDIQLAQLSNSRDSLMKMMMSTDNNVKSQQSNMQNESLRQTGDIVDLNEQFQAFNGVVLKDFEGQVLKSGDNYSMIEYQEHQRMNMTMYRTKFKNNFNINLKESLKQGNGREKSVDLMSNIDGIQKVEEGQQSKLSQEQSMSISQFREKRVKSREGFIYSKNKNIGEVLDQSFNLSQKMSFQATSRNMPMKNDKNTFNSLIRNSFDKPVCIDTPFSQLKSNQNYSSTLNNLESGFNTTKYRSRLQTTATQRARNINTGQVLKYEGNKDDQVLNQSQKTLSHLFNLSIVGKVQEGNQPEEIIKIQNLIKKTVQNANRNQSVKNTSQIHRDHLKSSHNQSRNNAAVGNLLLNSKLGNRKLGSIRNNQRADQGLNQTVL
eukprot:403338072